MNSNTEDVLFLTPEDENNQLTHEDELNEKDSQISKSKSITQLSLEAGTDLDKTSSFEQSTNETIDNTLDTSDLLLHANQNESELNSSAVNNCIELNISKNADFILGNTASEQNSIPKDHGSKLDETLLTDMKYLFKNTRYFLIKSNNYDNVHLAKSKGVWSTPRVNEIKLNKAYRVNFVFLCL